MKIQTRSAKRLSQLSFLLVVAAHGLYSIGCHKSGFSGFLTAGLFFDGVPMVLPILSYFLKNYFVATIGAFGVLPWIGYAFYVDCIMPYQGGGASMMYVAIIFWGTPSAICGMLVAWLVEKAKMVEIV